MTEIEVLKCLNHPEREAVARCPSCLRFFCRECITEYSGKVLCSSCLRKAHDAQTRLSARSWLSCGTAAAAGFMMLWLIFYSVGRILASIPQQTHGDTFWLSVNHSPPISSEHE